MKTPALLPISIIVLTAALLVGCSQAENKNATPRPTAAPTQTAAATVSGAAVPTPALPTATPSVPNAAATPAARLRNLPPEGGDKPTNAEVDGYAYSYKKDGEKTVATFGAKLLPGDSVNAAIRDVIGRSYGDKVTSAPHTEGTGPAQTIRIDGNKHQYIVVPIKDPTGDINSLMITRLN